ncbi:hypothetical protein Daus18300_011418 [Diaporthe australafricana]|uniref:Isochorismatase-like domain-containing protein n=1 Tax=Diaporthe australafricana TaxID=127596 RepID=A0ABR3W6X5_9PEZI
MDKGDVFLRKTRWYAWAGNRLEQILRAQNVDTVTITGLSLCGVVMSAVYRLFDLDYRIFIVRDCVVELPPVQSAEISKVMLGMLLPKMNSKAITIAAALEALARS